VGGLIDGAELDFYQQRAIPNLGNVSRYSMDGGNPGCHFNGRSVGWFGLPFTTDLDII
jgi:hypothetical protein